MSNAGFDMLTAKENTRSEGVDLSLHSLSLEKARGLARHIKAGNISKKFLDAILAELRDAPTSYIPKAGSGCGYMLARAASDIKIGMLSARSTVRLRP